MFSLFVLGAGFSAPAGLPLGRDLFAEIVRAAKRYEFGNRGPGNLYLNILKSDIDEFLEYKRRADGESLSEDDIDFEEFVTYQDLQHQLSLTGPKMWSSEGSRSQIAIRNLLAKVLHAKQRAMSDDARALYDRFANQLVPTDVIITFNYDTIVEEALARKGIPFRLYPNRYDYVGASFCTSSPSEQEVVVLKMHGSMDWFYMPDYEAQCKLPFDDPSLHFLVQHRESLAATRLVDDPYPTESPFHDVFRVRDLGFYLSGATLVLESPLLVSPSFSKVPYLNPLRDLWYGLNHYCQVMPNLAIVGFSLPGHDEYVRQPIYHIVRNFQDTPASRYLPKSHLKIVDLRTTPESAECLKKRFRFVDWTKADMCLTGFDRCAVDFLFAERVTPS